MKTFDEIYEELQSGENNELKKAWEEARKESQKRNKIILIICLVIDIFAIIMFFNKGINTNSLMFLMPMIMPIFVINIIVAVIISIISSINESFFLMISALSSKNFDSLFCL